MRYESPLDELARLNREQNKARQDEVFGGFSPAERAEYNGRAKRIYELESKIQVNAVAKKSSSSVKEEQRRQWNKASETDTPQSEAQQPYRSREKDSASSTNMQRRKAKKASEEKDTE